MHIIIVDDFISDQNRLRETILSDCAENRESVDFSCYDSGEDFLASYRPGSCDALFLDIVMGALSGIDAAKKIRERESRLPIIFTTTEPGFALDSYAVHAMDYLLKPVQPKKVSWCLSQLREYLAVPACVELRTVDAAGHSSLRKFPLDEIVCVQSRNHSLILRTAAGECRSTLTFQELQKLLPQTGRFFVCGRGVMVNLSHVETVENGALVLKTGERLAFTRRRQAEVESAVSAYLFSLARKGGWA